MREARACAPKRVGCNSPHLLLASPLPTSRRFAALHRDSVKDQDPNMSAADVRSKLSEMWKMLDDDAKNAYNMPG